MEEIVSHDNIGGYEMTSKDNIVETVRVVVKDVHPVTNEKLDCE